MATEANQLPAVQLPAVKLPDLTKDLAPAQIGWLRLGQLKADYFGELQKGELVVQGFLNNIEVEEDLVKVQDKVKQAKAQIEIDKQRRLTFTNYLTAKLFEPAMEFEKRNFTLLNAASKHELTLRTKAVEKQNQELKKETEKAQLKAHITNEHERIASLYRITLNGLILDGYANALQGGFDKKTLQNHIEAIKKFIKETKLAPFNKFTRQLVSDVEAKAIYAAVPVYDPLQDQQNALKKVDDTFATFEQDLANKQKAIDENKRQNEELVQKEKENLEITTATNNLVSQAVNTTVVSNTFKIKKLQKVIVENSEAWALAVLRGFIGNWTDCKKYVKVKSWDKLSIGQMAEAIGKLVSDGTPAQFPTLKFEEIKK